MRILTLAVLVSTLATAACDDAKKPEAAKTTPSGSSSVAATTKPSASATVTPTAATTAPPPSASASANAAPPAAEGPPLVIVAMKFVPQPPGGAAPTVELHADGTIHVGGKLQGKITGARFEDKDGKSQGYVDKDGKLVSNDTSARDQGGFNDKDELVMKSHDAEVKFIVADDGTVSVTHDGKTEKMPLKIEGFKPAARRVAAMMAMLSAGAMESGRPHRPTMPSAVSTPPRPPG